MDLEQPHRLLAAKRSIMRVNPQRTPASTKRRRRALSCTTCRRRKVKCDRLMPCGQCVRSGTKVTCVYPPAPWKTSLSHPDSTSTACRRPQDQGPINVPISRTVRQMAPGGDSTKFVPSGYGRGNHDKGGPERDLALQSPLHADLGGAHYEQVSGNFKAFTGHGGGLIPPSSSTGLVQSLTPISFRGAQQKSRFFGRSHWATTLAMFPDVNAHLRNYYRNKQLPTDPGFSEYLSMKRLKHDLRGSYRRWQKAHDLHTPKLEELLPDRSLAEQLMKLYFSTFETTVRILHLPSFIEQWDLFWGSLQGQTDGSFSSDIFIAKLLALMACSGCLATRELLDSAGLTQIKLIQMCHNWIKAAGAWVGLLSGHSQLNLDVLQIKCMLLLAQQATAWEGDLACIASGSLVREAMLMGLHRDPSNFPQVSPYWAEIRKRLWLTVIELELEASLYNGIPLAISCDEFDSGLPMNIEDEDFSSKSTRLPPPRPANTVTRMSFQIALAQTLPTRILIAKALNRVQLNLEYDEVLKLSESLSTALACSPSELRCISSVGNPDRSKHGYQAFRASFFLFINYTCLLALHRPYYLQLADTHWETFVSSRRVCVQTSSAILAQLEYVAYCPSTKALAEGSNSPRAHIFQLKGGMFRDEIFHAAVTICFEIRLQSKDSVIDMLPGTISGYMDQSARYQRMALFESVESGIKYFETKVRMEKRATKMLNILYMLFLCIKSETSAASSRRGDEKSGEMVLTVDDACPLAARRCRELLLEGSLNASEGPGREDAASQTIAQRDLDQDWYFSLDPLSPSLIDTWSEMDLFTL
ncbi:hypothetical protein BJX61DRAFT_530813 [Aspergillus egyptiacus]|nr:hypothetical protein BJX61DRAFT_530813 [Aspergillus egyptiacus]